MLVMQSELIATLRVDNATLLDELKWAKREQNHTTASTTDNKLDGDDAQDVKVLREELLQSTATCESTT